MDRRQRIPWWQAAAWLASLALLCPPAPAQDSETSASATQVAEGEGVDDEDPRSIVVFNMRLQHIELGDSNSIDLVLFRSDMAVKRPRRPGVDLGTLRFDLPVGTAHLQGKEVTGLGDLYFQAINFRDLSRRFSLGSGLAFQLPTATEDQLGAGKWQVAPTLFPLLKLPARRALFFTRIQDFVSVAGDDDRRDVHYLTITPTLIKILNRRRAVLFDTEAVVDWERDGELSWKSGFLVATKLGETARRLAQSRGAVGRAPARRVDGTSVPRLAPAHALELDQGSLRPSGFQYLVPEMSAWSMSPFSVIWNTAIPLLKPTAVSAPAATASLPVAEAPAFFPWSPAAAFAPAPTSQPFSTKLSNPSRPSNRKTTW